MGLILTPAQEMRHLESLDVEATSERPTHLELKKYMPPIGDQGGQGSCVGWSTAYYMYTYARAKRMKLDPSRLETAEFQGSPAFIYNRPDRTWLTLPDGKKKEVMPGMTINEAINMLRQKGWANMQEMPYDQKVNNVLPSDSVQDAASHRKARQIIPFSTVGVEQIKTYLATMEVPLVLAIPVYTDFGIWDADENLVYSHANASSGFSGWHAITICGYDDSKRALLMVNSWGHRFGHGGYLWLSEDWVRQNAREIWGVAPGGLIPLDASSSPEERAKAALAKKLIHVVEPK